MPLVLISKTKLIPCKELMMSCELRTKNSKFKCNNTKKSQLENWMKSNWQQFTKSISLKWILLVYQTISRRDIYWNSWAIRESSLRISTEGLFMGGCSKTSTHGVTARDPLSPCLKSRKQENASAATPTLSGHLMVSLLVIVVRCCSTCLAKGTSQTKEQAKR